MDLPRIVFFGMNGPLSAVVLKALAAAGLCPVLVVQGVEKAPNRRDDVFESRSARRSGLTSWIRRAPETSEGDLVGLAHQLGVDTLRTSNPNALRPRAALHRIRPDAYVIASFPRLLSPDVIRLSRRGGLNVHPGRLPEERGAAPLFWALKQGRTEIGLTIHLLDEGEDTGDIVSRGTYAFAPGAQGRAILLGCAQVAAPLLIRALRGLLAGELVVTRQSKEGVGRCPRPVFRDGRIDPGRSAKDVFTFVAGCASAYSVFAECGGDRFFIARAESYDLSGRLPCEFVLTGDRLLLACSPGVVELELKREGGVLFSGDYEGP